MTLAELLVGIVIITILAGVGAFAGDAVIKSSKAGAANAAGVQFIEQYTALAQTGSTPQAAVLEAVNAVGGPATALAALPTVSTKVGQLNVSVNSAAAPTTVATTVEPSAEPAQLVTDGKLIRDARLDRYLAAHQRFAGTSALGVPSAFLRSATAVEPAAASGR